MTAVPIPHRQYSGDNNQKVAVTDSQPILALKELVADLSREQHKVQNLLSSLGFALRSFNNLKQFLEIVPLMAARVTDAEGGALVLFQPNGQVRLELLHCQQANSYQDISLALDKAIAHTNAWQKKARNIPGENQLPTSFAVYIDDKLKKYLEPEVKVFGTPILLKNKDRGRLYVFSRDESYSWTPTRRKLVQLVADQTAVAIANNDLTVELRQKERLDRELEIASEIQVHLLPSKCPQIAGVELAANCQTASRVGGDYYDFIPANYDQIRQNPDGSAPSQCVPWSITIGDVMGKGVPAGLIMTMTRGMLRAEVLNRNSPAKILQHLNRVMYEDLENSHRFVTLFYSEYDPKTGILSYSNAAHNPPLLWQAASSSIIPLDTLGMLIGLDAESEYEDAQIQLAPGDTIIYFTDGFTDGVNKNGDRFDEDNLVAAFKWACEEGRNPQGILEHLFERVQQFIGLGNRNGDDMTLVVMQVKSSQKQASPCGSKQ